jgi:hypothetical protein
VRIRANTLCLLGVVVGLVAIVSVWRYAYQVTPLTLYDWPHAQIETGFSLLGVPLGQLQGLQMTAVYIGAVLAVVGVLIGIATPLGGVLEVIGACLFLSVTPSEEFVGVIHGVYYYLRVGPFIALISGSLMVLSMVLPMVLERKPSFSALRRQLWTFTVQRQDDDPHRGRHWPLGTGLAAWIPIRSGRIRVLAAIAISAVIVAASVGLSLNDSYTKESVKITVLVTADASSAVEFTLSVDGHGAATIGTTRDTLRNYYVEAGDHDVILTVIAPLSEQLSVHVRLLPLESELVTISITDTSVTVS